MSERNTIVNMSIYERMKKASFAYNLYSFCKKSKDTIRRICDDCMIIGITGTNGAGENVRGAFARPFEVFRSMRNIQKVYCSRRERVSPSQILNALLV